MSEAGSTGDQGHGKTVLIVGAAILALIVFARGGTEQPAPTPSPTASKTARPKPGTQLYANQATAQREVRAMLKDPDSAKFEAVRTGWTSGAPVTCGYVNSRNGFGGMTGRQRFISGNVTAVEEQMPAGEMDKAWDRLC